MKILFVLGVDGYLKSSGDGDSNMLSFPGAIIGTNQLRETTPTENARPSKVMGVEHKASNLLF
jgi:hypothetical protein